MFIMDNKKCDWIYRKKSPVPRIIPLVLGDMICATNYGENLCNVSFGDVLGALLLGTVPGGGSCPGRGLLGLSPCHHHQTVLCSHLSSPVTLILLNVLGRVSPCGAEGGPQPGVRSWRSERIFQAELRVGALGPLDFPGPLDFLGPLVSGSQWVPEPHSLLSLS